MTVRLAVESLVSMVRRWMLSHDIGVNSAAKPAGHIQLLCVAKFAFLGECKPSASALRMAEP